MDLDDVRDRLPAWDVAPDGIQRTYEVDDFAAAMALAVHVGLEAQRRNHHPDLTIGWGRLEVSLTTHDADSTVTDQDVDLAEWIEGVAPSAA